MNSKRLSKVLSLSILAIVAVMAVNATAAQAEWKLNGGVTLGNGELLLELLVIYGLKEILIGSLGAHIHCEEGIAIEHYETLNKKTVLDFEEEALLLECEVLGFAKTCIVSSPGQSAGTIASQGEGVASMSGTETFVKMSSENFGEFGFSGTFCPFNGIGGVVSGEMKVGIEGEETEASHSGYIEDVVGTMWYGEEELELHGGNLAEPVTATAKKVGGGSWGISL